jgi:hypothetical protein
MAFPEKGWHLAYKVRGLECVCVYVCHMERGSVEGGEVGSG